MKESLQNLLELLQLEQIEETIFRGQSQDLGLGNVFGGQVIGQSLSAAKQTVDEGRSLHSFHCYFLRPGDPNKPIIYEVDKARDGGSFSTRRVVAIQKGKPIFNIALSFQSEEESFEHQLPTMPDVPGPEGLEPEIERIRRISHILPQHIQEKLKTERPIEMRVVETPDFLNPEPMQPIRHIWLKACDTLPDDLRIHKYLLAYVSDFSFVSTALNPHSISFWDPKMMVASIDHAMWFHRSFRMDDWLLYSIESPTATGARGLARGQIFSRDGQLVASTMQEGLFRSLK